MKNTEVAAPPVGPRGGSAETAEALTHGGARLVSPSCRGCLISVPCGWSAWRCWLWPKGFMPMSTGKSRRMRNASPTTTDLPTMTRADRSMTTAAPRTIMLPRCPGRLLSSLFRSRLLCCSRNYPVPLPLWLRPSINHLDCPEYPRARCARAPARHALRVRHPRRDVPCRRPARHFKFAGHQDNEKTYDILAIRSALRGAVRDLLAVCRRAGCGLVHGGRGASRLDGKP